jgi:hypothetical protein
MHRIVTYPKWIENSIQQWLNEISPSLSPLPKIRVLFADDPKTLRRGFLIFIDTPELENKYLHIKIALSDIISNKEAFPDFIWENSEARLEYIRHMATRCLENRDILVWKDI